MLCQAQYKGMGTPIQPNSVSFNNSMMLHIFLPPPPGVHKTGIRGIQDTRQIVDCKTNDIENNNKKGGSKPLT